MRRKEKKALQMLPYGRPRLLPIHRLSNLVKTTPTKVRLLTTPANVKSLEDLAKLKSLDDVDPTLIQKLINEKTSELNTLREIEVLKRMQEERENRLESNNVSLKQFVRPGIILFLMSSSVYLVWQLLWLNLEYTKREQENMEEISVLENSLQSALTNVKKPKE